MRQIEVDQSMVVDGGWICRQSVSIFSAHGPWWLLDPTDDDSRRKRKCTGGPNSDSSYSIEQP